MGRYIREVQPEPRYQHEPLGQLSGKQEQQQEDEAVVMDAAAEKIGAAARGPFAKAVGHREEERANKRRGVERVSAAVEAKRAEAKAMQEAAQKQLEAARAAVASAHNKLKAYRSSSRRWRRSGGP